MCVCYYISELISKIWFVLHFILEFLTKLVIDSHCWDTLPVLLFHSYHWNTFLSFLFDDFRNWFNIKFSVAYTFASALRPHLTVCTLILNALFIRQLEVLHLLNLRRSFFRVTCINYVSCTTRVSHCLAVILLKD